jgi:hypothetical protein
MKKIFSLIPLLAILFLIPSALAVNLKVEPQESRGVIINGIDRPAIFSVKITNLGASDNLQFYNLLGFSMAPKGTVNIATGESKVVSVMVYPKENFKYNGFYNFKYSIRGQDGSEISSDLSVKFVDFNEMFEVGSGEVSPETNSMKVYVYNRENFEFESISSKFNSPFFSFERNFSLLANEREEFDVQLNKEDFKKLMAGFYTLNAEISTYGKTTDVEGTIKFVERDILTSTKSDYGIIVNTQVISKKNEGNVPASTETVVKKNIFSRLFTSFSPEPDSVERQGLAVYYTWARQINPGEELNVTVRTNWLLPFVSVLFIIAVVIIARVYSSTNLVVRKKVSFVNAKGGEFALKVSLMLNAKNYVEKISVIDRLPPLIRVYERFGSEKPKRVNERERKIEWEFDKLEKGETRVLSYIVYSKIGVVGKFALPTATAIYERNGRVHEAESNMAFFVAEQRKGDIE